MYNKEDYSVKNQRHFKFFRLESNSYVNYLPTGAASGVDVVVKFSKREEK